MSHVLGSWNVVGTRYTQSLFLDLIPGSRSSPGEGNGNSLQYSYLANSMDRAAWRVTVRGVTKSQAQLSAHTHTHTHTHTHFIDEETKAQRC